MWSHERLAACHRRHDEDEAFPSWLPTLNRHHWEQYWFAASGSAYASNIFTADTEKRKWFGSICLEQFKAHICVPYSRFEIFKTVENLTVFFWVVTSQGYTFFRGIFFFKVKFVSEAWRSRFVRNVCSHLHYVWHKWSRLTSGQDPATNLIIHDWRKEQIRLPLMKVLHSSSCISGETKLEIKCEERGRFWSSRTENLQFCICSCFTTKILCACREVQSILATTVGQLLLLQKRPIFWAYLPSAQVT